MAHITNKTTGRLYPYPSSETLNKFAILLSGKNLKLKIDHNATTAYINLKENSITIPLWDVPQSFFRFLVGHECAHGLWTSYDIFKDKMEEFEKSEFSKMYSHIFSSLHNVIEDIRIDKMIQSKYKGLVADYRDSVQFLYDSKFNPEHEDNIADCADQEIDSNLKKDKTPEEIEIYKCMKEFTRWVNATNFYYKTRWDDKLSKLPEFTGREKELFEKSDTCYTEDQVYGLVDEIIQHFFDEQKLKDHKPEDMDLDEFLKTLLAILTSDVGDLVNVESGISVGSHNAKILDESTMTDKQKEMLGKILENLNTKIDQRDNSDGEVRKGASGHGYEPINGQYQPDKNYINWKQVVKHYKSENNKVLKDIRNNVNDLVRNFEMRKNAREFMNTKHTKTGILDQTRLHLYKSTPDIFLENEVRMIGDNYGFYMLLDYSGSMDSKKTQVTEYAYLMSMFFKRIGVPFKLWTVGLSINGLRGGMIAKHLEPETNSWYSYVPIELFSSEMSKSQLNSVYNGVSKGLINGSCSLGSTPLTNTLLTTRHTLENFISGNGIDKLSYIAITDGGDDLGHLRDSIGLYDTTTGRYYQSESNLYYGNAIKLVRDIFDCEFVAIDINKYGDYPAEVEYTKSYNLTNTTIDNRGEFSNFAKDFMKQILQ